MSDRLCASSLLLGLGLGIVSQPLAQQFEAVRKTSIRGVVAPALDDGIAVDVDQNGTIDILLRSGSLLLNDGHLGFDWLPPGTRVPLTSTLLFPSMFRLADDIDGDGDIDLVASTFTFSPLQTLILVLPGAPGGVWSSAQVAGTVPGIGIPVALRDVDGDGLPDLFIGGGTPTYALLHNTGSGNFVDVTATHLPANPTGSPRAFADVDGDGDLDFVTAGAGLPIELLLNDGTGHFTVSATSALPTLASVQSIAFGDVDSDGDADLLVATASGAPIQVLRNAGLGAFVPSTSAMPPSGSGVRFADIDGDGDVDLLLVGRVGNTVQLQPWRNDGTGQFVALATTEVDDGSSLGDPVLADLDGDGDLDVVLGGTLVYLDDGHQHYQPLWRRSIPSLDNGGTVLSADLDGDGDLDLVLGAAVLQNEGDGFFARTQQNVPMDGVGRAMVDADGDGDLDLVWTPRDLSFGGGLMLNQGGVLVAQPMLPIGQLRGEVVVADFDHDGLADLCSQAGVVLRNLGSGNFQPIAQAPFADHGPLTAADFDGDGFADLAIGNGQGWAQWRNLGNMAFQQVAAFSYLALTAVAAGDIDGDGDVDLVSGAFSSGFGGSFGWQQVWTNQNGMFTAGAFYIDGNLPPTAVALADVDEDGALDLIGGQVWINDGTGSFFDRMSGLQQYFGKVGVADLDRDGDVDIIVAFENGAELFVNRHRHLGAPVVPVLGQPYRIEMAVRPGYGNGGDLVLPALAFARIAPVVVPGLGVLHIDPAAALFGSFAVTGPDGVSTFPVQVPNDPALAGIEAFWQGLTVEPNGVHLTGFVREALLR